MRTLDPLDYPFGLPAGDFLWHAGSVRPVTEWDWADAGHRSPVLAIGSLAAPAQLDRSFGARRWRQPGTPDAMVPVFVVRAFDVDVVYSAHLDKGSVPATLVDAPGAEVTVRLGLFTPAQMSRIGEVERFGTQHSLRSVRRVERNGQEIRGVYCYTSKAGPALFNGRAVGLDIACSGSAEPCRGDQRYVWHLLACEMGYPNGVSLSRQCQSTTAVRELVLGHLNNATRRPGRTGHF